MTHLVKMKLRSACVFAFALLIGAAGFARQARADVRLPAFFSDHMVIQREKPVPVWGRAEPGEAVTVSFAGQRKSGVADASGRWSVRLDKMRANASPQTLTVTGRNVLTVKDVLIGEVWLCSGQSNMTYRFGYNKDYYAADIAAANDPGLRCFLVDFHTAPTPENDLQYSPYQKWETANPDSAAHTFPAVGYYFGQALRRQFGPSVPIGLIHCSYPATPAEAWVSREALLQNPALAEMADKPNSTPQYRATFLYNAMIHPLLPCAMRGAIWYQGESNAGRAYQYRALLPALIADWRSRWGQGNFPFYIVQLANFMATKAQPGESAWAELREAQALTVKRFPKSGLAVTIDVGDANDIHPKDKKDVGERLALLALAKTYGRKMAYSGPQYVSFSMAGSAIRLKFQHTAGSLAAKGGAPLKQFAIAGADKKFVWADARIVGDTVVVSSPQVPHPVAVRYA